MKVLLFLILGILVSCSDTSDPNYGTTELLVNTNYFTVNYNGPWKGNVISNDSKIYSISGNGNSNIVAINGLAISKDDVTLQVIEISKINIREYDNGVSTKHTISESTKDGSVIRIE